MLSSDLTYEFLDDLAVAVDEGTLSPDAELSRSVVASRIGPLVELMMLHAQSRWPRSVMENIKEGRFQDFMTALRARRNLWIGANGTIGFMRLGEDYGDDEETRWTSFGLKSDKAMQTVGLPAGLAGQLVGATKELHSNVYEHSERSRSGIVAFAVHKKMAEFIVADSGIGVLASLRTNPVHTGLQRDGEALHLALQPGVSRYASDPTRGHGFDLMFTGLLNHGSKLRFRSGTAAVTIDGLAKGNPVPIIRDRPALPGFLIGVDCHATGRSGRRIVGCT